MRRTRIRRRPALAGIAAGLLLLGACSSDAQDTDDEPVEDLTSDTDDPEATEDEGPDDPDLDEEASAGDTDDGEDADDGGDEGPADDPDPDDDPAEEDPAEEDPFAVPDEIDEDYAELVLNELLAIRSELEREMLERPVPSSIQEDDAMTAEAIYAGPELIDRVSSMQGLLNSEERRETRIPPEESGQMRFDVLELGDANKSCMTVFGWPDLTEVSRHPFDPDTHGAFVLTRNDEIDPELNPTGWQLWDNALLTTPEDEPIPQEAWAGLDFDDALDTACGGQR